MELDKDLMTEKLTKEKLMKLQKETLVDILLEYTNATGIEIKWEYLKEIEKSLYLNKEIQRATATIHLMEQLDADLPKEEEIKICAKLNKMLLKERKSKKWGKTLKKWQAGKM